MKQIEKFIAQQSYSPFDLKAVFFDMDGVLFDSMAFHAVSWRRTMQSNGFPFTEEDAYMNEGRTGEATINDCFLKYRGRPASEEEREAMYAEKGRHFESCGPVKPLEHVLELLQKIKSQGLEIYIVTGSAQRSLLNTLQHHFKGIFKKEKMVTAFDVTHGKPNPEPYLMALQKANIQPWQAVVIENAPLGIQSSVSAGIFTIAVNTGILNNKVLIDAGAHVVYPSINDLLTQWHTIYDKK
ncbi:MAG TPA: HAD-IA family hydrolase [Paludibacteraceae bacterium]|nr:HAD-IA family hydrolase [Paludibacteraceae bacterium]